MPLDPDLLAMGRQAGYLPPDYASDSVLDSQPAAPEDNGSMNAYNPTSMQGGLTPPDVQLQSPRSVDSPRAAAPSNVGVGASYRGFSNDAYNRVSKTQTGLDAEMAAADRQAAAGADRNASILAQGAAPSIDAAKQEGQAMANKATAQGEQALVMQRLQDGFAAEEAKINASATAQANQSKADYLNALMDFRAARVDPSQLWGNMSKGTQVGMLATAFVHDFLGVKGIHTSAMDTFNKAVDRNIDAQLQAIKTKGEVAEGFKSLWYMQRNQSASDAEARTRVRGFLLEGAKQQVISNMAQYESALASAQGQAAVAKIDEELSKNLIAVYQHADGNALQLRNQALEKWKTKVNASLEQQSLNLRANELALKKAEMTKGQMLEPIYDPESHEAKWVFNPNLNLKDTEKEAVRTRLAAVNEVNKAMNELRELARTGNSTFDMINGSRLANTTGQAYEALANRIAHGMAKANNEKATDKDVDQYRQGMPVATTLQRGDIEKLLARTQRQLLDQTSILSTYASDITPEQSKYFGKSASQEGFDASRADAKNTINPPPKGQEELLREQAGKYLTDAGTQEDISGDSDALTEGIQGVKADFIKANPQFAGTSTKATGDQLQDKLDNKSSMGITVHDKGLMMLARAAQGGDAKALTQLKEQANSYLIGKQADEDGMFAAYLYNMVAPDRPAEGSESAESYNQ